MLRNPYPGPQPFQPGQPLYGRERETLELLDLLIAERVVLLYSPSGAGKTSLVQAALIPQLQQEGYQVLPVIRLKFDPGPGDGSRQQNRFVRSALLALEEGLPVEKRTDRADLASFTLDEYLGRLPVEGIADGEAEEAPSQVLIFDQFEEILTIEPTELAAKEQFFAEAGKALCNRNRWGLFVMREDYIAGLSPYVRHIPTRLNTTYRLDLLGSQAATDAICKPAREAGVDFTTTAAEKLVNDLRWVQVQRADGAVEPRLGPYVEPVQLQVVCWRLWDGLPEGTTQITEDNLTAVHAVDEALAEYYAECIAAIAAATGEPERAIRNWFGRYLITEQGVRGQVLMSKGSSQGLRNTTIRLLEDAHLVRADERRGAIWFELAHDRFVAPIRADNAAWVQHNLSMLQLQAELWDTHERQPGLLLQGESLVQAEEWADLHAAELTEPEQDFLASCREARRAAKREERNHRRLQWLAVLVAILAVAAALFAAYAARQNQIAEAQRKVATARQLAAQSLAVADYEVDTSLLLAVEAYTSEPLEDVRSSLAAAAQCCSDSLHAFMRGHTDRVWDVAFSADSQLLASSGDDGTIIVWDVASRTAITTIVNPQTTATVYTVAFSPRGDILAAGDGDGEIILRNTNSWQLIGEPLRVHDFNVHSLVFSNDGSLLVSGGGDGKVVVWSVADRTPVRTFTGHINWVWDVAISPDNRTVASVGRDPAVRLWSMEASGTLTPSVVMTTPHSAVVTSVAFNQDPVLPLMITGDTDGYVVLWDMRHWQQDHEAPLAIKPRRISLRDTYIWGLAFVPGRNLSFVSSASHGILTRQHIMLATDMRKASLRPEKLGVAGHSGAFRLAISPDGKTVAAAGADKLVSLWTADEAPNVLWHSASIDSMNVIAPPRQLVALDRNGRLFHWDYGEGKMRSRVSLSPSVPFSVSAISDNGAVIATGDYSGTVTLWDGATGKQRSRLESALGPIESLAMSRDGALLAAGDAVGRVVLWDGGAPFELSAAKGPGYAMKKLLFSLDGKILIGGSCGHPITFPVADCGRGGVSLWDVAARRPAGAPLPGQSGFVLSLALNPANGNELAVGTRDGNITVWDWRMRAQKHSFGVGSTADIKDLAYSPDGRLLAVAIDSSRIYLFNPQTGRVFGRYFLEHDAAVNKIVFSPDGELLLSGAMDKTIVIHDMRLEHWLQRACQIANRNLNKDEWQRYVNADPATYHPTCPAAVPAAEQAP